MFKGLSPRARQKRLQRIVFGVLVVVLSMGLIGSSIAWTGFGVAPNEAQYPTTLEDRIKLLEQQAQDKPGDTDLLMSLASFYVKAGRNEQAIATYEKAIKNEPANIPARQNLALLYYTQGNLDATEQQLEKALEAEPANVEVNFQYAKLKAEKKEYDIAIASMEKVLQTEKEGPRAEEARRAIEDWKSTAGR